MRLFIAEKPELAKAVASGLGRGEFKDGFIAVNNNLVTWAYGHIFELEEPVFYNTAWEAWSLNTLPISLNANQFRVKPKESAKKQVKIILDLIKSSGVTSIVNAGDPDEEGTILIDEIIKYSKTTKPIERILINDLTQKAVQKAISEIRPFKEFNLIANSGYARSYADWLTGLNFTRFYTLKGNQSGHKGVLSVGRVQSPILSLIVSRDEEHESHKESIYYVIKASFSVVAESFTASLSLSANEKITDLNEINKIKEICLNKTASAAIKTEELSSNPPLPYNLVNLQIDMSKRYKLKPAKTLEITQTLREKYKLITYNRSDCEYLPEEFHLNASVIVSVINNNLKDKSFGNSSKLDTKIKSGAFNNSKITAHHAIIPTNTKIDVSKLSNDEMRVYQAIAERYLLQFFPNKEYRRSSITLNIENYAFKASYTQILNRGWTDVYQEESAEEKEEDTNNVDFSKYSDNDIFICKNIESKEAKTKPLPYFKQETLLKALVSLSSYVKDPKIKELLLKKDDGTKARGSIGTEATRANHIETLYKRGYIEDIDKGYIRSTKLGREFIKQLPPFLVSPDMTALWFEKQEMIKENRLSLNDFINDINKHIANNLPKEANLTFEKKEEESIPCPICKDGHLKRWKHKEKDYYYWSCSNFKEKGCKAWYKDNKGKPVIEEEIVCPQCKIGKLRQWKSKDGKSYYWSCSNYKESRCKTYRDNKGKPEI